MTWDLIVGVDYVLGAIVEGYNWSGLWWEIKFSYLPAFGRKIIFLLGW